MTANDLVIPLVAGTAGFIGFMAIPLLGLAIVRMIGKPSA